MAALLDVEQEQQEQPHQLVLIDGSTSASSSDPSLALVPLSEPQLPKLSTVPIGLAMTSGVGIHEHWNGSQTDVARQLVLAAQAPLSENETFIEQPPVCIEIYSAIAFGTTKHTPDEAMAIAPFLETCMKSGFQSVCGKGVKALANQFKKRAQSLPKPAEYPVPDEPIKCPVYCEYVCTECASQHVVNLFDNLCNEFHRLASLSLNKKPTNVCAENMFLSLRSSSDPSHLTFVRFADGIDRSGLIKAEQEFHYFKPIGRGSGDIIGMVLRLQYESEIELFGSTTDDFGDPECPPPLACTGRSLAASLAEACSLEGTEVSRLKCTRFRDGTCRMDTHDVTEIAETVHITNIPSPKAARKSKGKAKAKAATGGGIDLLSHLQEKEHDADKGTEENYYTGCMLTLEEIMVVVGYDGTGEAAEEIALEQRREAGCLTPSRIRRGLFGPSVRPSVRPVVRSLVRPPVRPSVRSPVRPPGRPSARSPDRPSVRPPDRPIARSPVRPSVRSSDCLSVRPSV